MAVELIWLGHASFRIQGSAVVYIDPWKLSGEGRADVVAVSHSHYDHLSAPDVKAVAGRETKVAAAADCTNKLAGLNVQAMAPGDVLEWKGVRVEGVPAYNIGKPFHPRANNWLGFVIELDGRRIYYAGDTDLIPEMRNLERIDLALLPVGGTYTMNAVEAAQATGEFRPGRALPYHWGDIVGSESDARTFQAQAKCPVDLLKPGQSLKLA